MLELLFSVFLLLSSYGLEKGFFYFMYLEMNPNFFCQIRFGVLTGFLFLSIFCFLASMFCAIEPLDWLVLLWFCIGMWSYSIRGLFFLGFVSLGLVWGLL